MRVMLVPLIGAAALLAACSPDHASAQQMQDREIVLLPNPPDGGTVTWASWAGAFTKDYCVECHNPTAPCGGGGCHDPGDARLFDLRDQAQFVSRKEMIRCGVAATQDPSWSCGDTQPKQFPKATAEGNNPLPTDAQRQIVVDWINASCP